MDEEVVCEVRGNGQLRITIFPALPSSRGQQDATASPPHALAVLTQFCHPQQSETGPGCPRRSMGVFTWPCGNQNPLDTAKRGENTHTHKLHTSSACFPLNYHLTSTPHSTTSPQGLVTGPGEPPARVRARKCGTQLAGLLGCVGAVNDFITACSFVLRAGPGQGPKGQAGLPLGPLGFQALSYLLWRLEEV